MPGVDATWTPLEVSELGELLAGGNFAWWLAGGIALERFVGRVWREHGDIDIVVWRDESAALRDHLRARGWISEIARAGGLRRWSGALPTEANSVWCRPASGAWSLQVMFADRLADRWQYRRDRRIGGALDSFGVVVEGVPLLAPEIQLLYKSKDVRDVDQADFDAVLPHLDATRRAWLLAQLPADHRWRDALRGRATSSP